MYFLEIWAVLRSQRVIAEKHNYDLISTAALVIRERDRKPKRALEVSDWCNQAGQHFAPYKAQNFLPLSGLLGLRMSGKQNPSSLLASSLEKQTAPEHNILSGKIIIFLTLIWQRQMLIPTPFQHPAKKENKSKCQGLDFFPFMIHNPKCSSDFFHCVAKLTSWTFFFIIMNKFFTLFSLLATLHRS